MIYNVLSEYYQAFLSSKQAAAVPSKGKNMSAVAKPIGVPVAETIPVPVADVPVAAPAGCCSAGGCSKADDAMETD